MTANAPRFSPLHFIRCWCAGAVLCMALTASAEPSPSLVPVFGDAGHEFKQKAQPGHDIHGWLPKGWEDNSSWAKVSAVYTKLSDSPDVDAGAVRIEVTKVDAHHVQFRPQKGPLAFKRGTTYSVTGWLRSAKGDTFNVGFRQDREPHDYFSRDDIETGPKWARFRFEWTPEEDCKAWLMFVVQRPGTIDVAGITLAEK